MPIAEPHIELSIAHRDIEHFLDWLMQYFQLVNENEIIRSSRFLVKSDRCWTLAAGVRSKSARDQVIAPVQRVGATRLPPP